MGLQHKLAHVLGGTFDLPHARVHAILLPHVVAWNGPAAPGAMRRLVRALGGDGATEGEGSGVPGGAAALERLNDRVGIPRSLAHLELDRGALEQVADLALEAPYANPRPVTRDGVREILESAWSGRSYL
jgi:maleylacetate reductase